MTDSVVSRRKLIGGVLAGGAAVAVGGPAGSRLGLMLDAKAAPAVLRQDAKLVYWGGLIFSDKANQLMVDEVKAWGEANGVDAEAVMINQNETNQKVSAAVESGSLPDALDLGLDLLLLLSNSGTLIDLTDLYDKIGSAQGGWYPSVDEAVRTELLGGMRTGLPYGAGGNLLFQRADVLKEAGLTPPPKTWEELVSFAEKVQKPPLYGLGLALSNVGDGNLQMSVMQSYGGRIADDAGKQCTIKSDATKTYLEWVSGAYAKGLFSPGATTWDGAGDNTAYLAGQAVFIANTGSVAIAAKKDDPELYDATAYAPLPEGPKGRVSPINPVIRSIPKTTKDQDRAKALLEHLNQPEFLEKYYNVAIYGPVLKGQDGMAAFEDPVRAGLKELIQSGTAPGAPDQFNTAYAEVSANFLIPKMVQRVVVDGYDLDKAMDEAQAAGQAIYDKYNK